MSLLIFGEGEENERHSNNSSCYFFGGLAYYMSDPELNIISLSHYTHTHTPLLGGYHPKETEVSNGAHICSGLRMGLPQ